MIFKVYYDGILKEEESYVSDLLRWMSDFPYELPNNVIVNINIEDGVKK